MGASPALCARHRGEDQPAFAAKPLAGAAASVASAAFSPDGRWVVSAGADGTVRVWNWAGGTEVTVLRGHEDAVNRAEFSPDGRWLVSAGKDGTMRVWDWAGGGEPTTAGPRRRNCGVEADRGGSDVR